MKLTLTLIITFLFKMIALGQSPFNYGQNDKVYFISTQQREKLDLSTIYSIDQRNDNDISGMWGNWDVVALNFSSTSITEEWSPISLENNFAFNIDTIINKFQYLNGSRYEFYDNNLTAYGGEGYGSFDWKDIFRLSVTVSVIVTYCTGHCGDQPAKYSKNTFNDKGKVLYSVSYPYPSDTADLETDSITLAAYEIFLNSNVNEEHLPDTLFYHYDEKGLLLNDSKETSINSTNVAIKLFSYNGNKPESKFHQCYVGNVRMEDYFFEKLGRIPELVLIEIYHQGVFSFTLDTSEMKYYSSKTIVLER